jgi:hypothetical protein
MRENPVAYLNISHFFFVVSMGPEQPATKIPNGAGQKQTIQFI